MNGLIVAGLASVAGIGGVVGLTQATVDTGSHDAGAPAVSMSAADDIERRLARVREAERIADRALTEARRRADAAASVTAGGAYDRDAGNGERYEDDERDEEHRDDHDDDGGGEHGVEDD